MESAKWNVLRVWYHANYKTLPKDVSDAIQTLIDERDSEDDGVEACEECGHDLTAAQIADGETICHRCAGEPEEEYEY